jgi:dTDP-4-amino-4,6-dideoxygalactose transaminase
MTPLIPIALPSLGEREADAARRVILSGWVTQGPEVAAFEREFAAAVGAPHACAVSNATTALHLALLACGVGPGDEVVTVSHSFIATANVVRYCGATPVFVDVQPHTYNIDPELVEGAIGPRTKAILCVHQLGMPCDLAALVALAGRHSLPLVEDAACAIGSEVRWNGEWERIGRPHGDVACFSFHPRKVLTTGDGGMLTTRNGEWDSRFRLWRQHGMSVPDTVRHASARVVNESYAEVGYNYRMTDIQAAVGREQLARLDLIVERRRERAARYHELLRGLPVDLPEEPPYARSNWQTYCVVLQDGLDQEAVMQSMLDAGVATRRGVMCAHREPAYADGGWRAAGPLNVGTHVQDHGVALPLFHDMTDEQQERVVDALGAACAASTAGAASPR